jgi:RTP801 C-terminal region
VCVCVCVCANGQTDCIGYCPVCLPFLDQIMPLTAYPVIRNASYPSQDALTSKDHRLDKRSHSSSMHTLHSYRESIDVRARLKSSKNNFLQRMTTRVMKFFQDLTNESKVVSNVERQPSTFVYDPEYDLHEEQVNVVSQRLLASLSENKIKHLSCDHLLIPCDHLRTIARQCLIMSAEEPFGIKGAQIRIRLTLNNGPTKYLPVIRINPDQKTICEIEIDLHEDTKVLTLRRLLPDMKFFQNFKEKSPLYVSPRCTLIKRVFYKTAEPKHVLIDTMTQ